jgi:hypothetical protein
MRLAVGLACLVLPSTSVEPAWGNSPEGISVQGEKVCLANKNVVVDEGRNISEWSDALRLDLLWPDIRPLDRRKDKDLWPAQLISISLQVKSNPSSENERLQRHFLESRLWNTEEIGELVRRFEPRVHAESHSYSDDFVYSKSDPARFHFRCSSSFGRFHVNKICSRRMTLWSNIQLEYTFDFKMIEESKAIHLFVEQLFSKPPCN